MQDSFYIISTQTGTTPWYLLCEVSTHICLSCGSDLSALMDKITEYVKRHRTKYHLQEALRNLSYPAVNGITVARRQEYYENHKEDYSYEIHKAVERAFVESRKEEKNKSPLRKTLTLKKINTGITPAPTEHCSESRTALSKPNGAVSVKSRPKVKRITLLK